MSSNSVLVLFLSTLLLLGALGYAPPPGSEGPSHRAREPREYCKAVNLDHEEHSLIDLSVPTTLAHTQTSCSKVFVFEITQNLVGQNILIEILLTGKVPEREKFLPFLAVRKNDRPHIYVEGIATYNVVADGSDEIAYNFTLNYHHYVVKKHTFALGDKIYFAFYQRDSGSGGNYDESIHYTVTLSAHADMPCPRQCSDHGSCNTATGVCACQKDYYLPDCSAKLNEHTIETTYDVSIASNEWYFFYHDRSQDLDTELDLKVRELDNNRMAIIVRYQGENIKLPSERFFHYIYHMKKENPEAVFGISHLDLKKLGSSVVVGVKNKGKDTFLNIVTEKKKRTPRYVVYLIIGGIITMIGGLLFCGIYIGEREDRKGRYANVTAETTKTDETHSSIELSGVGTDGSVITKRKPVSSEKK